MKSKVNARKYAAVKIIFVLSLAIFLSFSSIFMFGCEHTNTDEGYKLIRIHVRANSNSESDQAVKLKVRDALNDLIVEKIDEGDSFDTAYRKLDDMRDDLRRAGDSVLKKNGFTYKCRVRLNNEYFPTRTYEGVVVESGYYDALIVELGEGKGDNWWCVVYPPLCYVSDGGEGGVHYKSLVMELWKKFVSTFRK